MSRRVVVPHLYATSAWAQAGVTEKLCKMHGHPFNKCHNCQLVTPFIEPDDWTTCSRCKTQICTECAEPGPETAKRYSVVCRDCARKDRKIELKVGDFEIVEFVCDAFKVERDDLEFAIRNK